jgi:PST family polysaccharide transporter
LVALAYGEPALRPMLQVVAITFTCNGLSTQYRADLTRRLQFGRLVGADVIAQAAGLAVGITGAVLGAGYWALVAQLVAQSVTALLAVALAARWLPGRPRRGAEVRPFVRFGRMLALSAIVNYLSNNLDVLTIAARLGTTPLGIYNRAFSLLMSPLNQLRSPATTVALPVLSRLQDDYVAAGRYVSRGQLSFGYTIVPALAICAGASTPIVHLMLGAKWSAAAPVLGCLAVAGASTLLAYPGYWVYLSRGLGPALFRYTCMTLVLQAVCIGAGSWWGITGVAAGYMTAALLEWPLSLFWLARLTVLPLRELLTGALRVTMCGALAGGASWFAVHGTGQANANWKVALGLAVGLAVYAASFALVPPVRRDIRLVVQTGRRMIRR